MSILEQAERVASFECTFSPYNILQASCLFLRIAVLRLSLLEEEKIKIISFLFPVYLPEDLALSSFKIGLPSGTKSKVFR